MPGRAPGRAPDSDTLIALAREAKGNARAALQMLEGRLLMYPEDRPVSAPTAAPVRVPAAPAEVAGLPRGMSARGLTGTLRQRLREFVETGTAGPAKSTLKKLAYLGLVQPDPAAGWALTPKGHEVVHGRAS